MRTHIVAERELRTAARRKATYWVRWSTAVVFFALLIWLMWAMDALTRNGGAHDVFSVLSVMVFFYCLIIGAVRTADCISGERREGTLGLLFLTNLNSFEIIAGKLLSNALPAIYGLVAIFPIMGVPLLIGGVTFPEFLRVVLALLAAILFSLGCGILSSVICRRHFAAVAMAMGLVLSIGTLTFLGAAIAAELKASNFTVQTLASLSPLYAVSAGLEGKIFGANHYWQAVTNVCGMSALLLAVATLLLARSWRDRASAHPKLLAKAIPPSAILAAPTQSRRLAFRERLLDVNPFGWLAARKHRGAPVFTLLLLAAMVLVVAGTTPLFNKISAPARVGPALGEMLAWLCAAGLLHVLMFYYAAMLGAQTYAEDKQSGALELIFSTPASVTQILQGNRMAFRRQILLPGIIVTLVHGYAFWKIMAVVLLEPPGQVNMAEATRWDALLASLFNVPIHGRHLEWGFVVVMRVIALILPTAIIVWFALAQSGRWLGLRMKHPGFAPLLSITLITVPSILAISMVVYLVDELNLDRYNERIVIPAMMATAFLIVLGNCALLAAWARYNLQENFRATVIGRFDRVPKDWSRVGRTTLRFALQTCAVVMGVLLLFVVHHAWKNHSSKRTWTKFQAKMNTQGISLDPASALPPAVPDSENFACTPIYTNLFLTTNTPLARLLVQLPEETPPFIDWSSQQLLSLWRTAVAIGLPNVTSQIQTMPSRRSSRRTNNSIAPPPGNAKGTTNQTELAAQILVHLATYDSELRELTEAAKLPAFRPGLTTDITNLLNPSRRDILTLRKAHALYTTRALASLHTNQCEAAMNDVLTGLRLAQLTGQSRNIEGSTYAQLMMLSSFQPLWEGLTRHQWNPQQLVAVEKELAYMNPTVDFTNAINLTVRTHIALWVLFPNQAEFAWQIPSLNGYTQRSQWRGMHRNWWYDCAIELYHVGEDAKAFADLSRTDATNETNWGTIWELPLTDSASAVFQRVTQVWQKQPWLLPFGQTSLHQARAAVAMEQFRLANGRLATNLSELVPHPLPEIPVDALTKTPLHYKLGTNGNPMLWGVGPNRRSDDTNSFSDDWVWTYPTNQTDKATER